MPIGIKFSQFIAGGNLKVTDKTVGVRDGLNTIFTDPSDGILDENGNYLLRYVSESPNAVNAVLFKNAATGEPAQITVGGSDSDASLKIYPKANGSLILETPSEGDITLKNTGNGSTNFISSGLGNINFSTNSGKVIINETTGINAILDEDNMASNSATAVSTQQSTKAYVDTSDTAIKSYSYITKTDNTANLPGSTPLSGLASGFLSNTTATGVLNPRTHTGTTNQINIANGSGVSGNPTYTLSSTLVTPGTVTLGGDLNVATHKIVSNSGTPIQLIPNNDSDGIDLASTIVRVEQDIRHSGESDNKIAFTTAAQTYYIGGTEQLRINSSGLRVKNNLSISDSQISTSSGDLTVSPFANLNLYGNGDVSLLSGLSGGAGNLSLIVNGSGNFIAETDSGNIGFNTTSGAYTFSVASSSVMDLNSSGFRLGMGYRVGAISNDAAAYLDTQLMTAYAIQTAIGNAIVGSNNFRGAWDASGGLFPTTGGTGPAGAVAAGNNWRISVAGTLGGEPVDPGDQIIAATAVPGQTASNWIIVNPRVFSVFGRTGSVVAVNGDYSYSQITGLPSTATSGKLMRGNGSAWAETTASYPDAASSAGTFLRADGSNWSASTATLPNTAGTSGTLLQSNATGFVNTTAAYPATAGISGTLLSSNGTNIVNTTAAYPATAGTANTLLTSNGTNIVNTTATYPSTAGTSGTILRSNGTNIVNSTPTFPNTATSGKIMRGDGTNWVESTPTFPNSGTSGKLIRGDGTNYVETTAQYPDAAGTSGNLLKSDGTNFVSSTPAKPSYGKAILTNGFGGVTYVFTTTSTELRGFATTWTLDPNWVDFDMNSDGRLRYIGAQTKWFYVSGKIANTDTTVQFAEVRKNGSVYNTSYFYSNAQWGSFGPSNTPMQLSANDYISFFIRRNGGSNSATIFLVELTAQEIFGAN